MGVQVVRNVPRFFRGHDHALEIAPEDGRGRTNDTLTCCHCTNVVVIPHPPAPVPGGWCHQCAKNTCSRPQCNGVDAHMNSFKARIDAAEKLRNRRFG